MSEPTGIWVCQNCGEVDPENVTWGEACGFCNEIVDWHSDALTDEIERLRSIIAGDHDMSIAEWHSDRAELLKRIAELEELQRETVEEINSQKGVFITDNQIDAAWAFLQDHETIASPTSDAIHMVLEMLGIVRCDFETPEEECVRGVIQHLEPGDNYGRNQRCPSCNGHGWVKK